MDVTLQPLRTHRSELRELLLGSHRDAMELPPLSELTTALTRLASGKRQKCLVPVGVSPLEYALVRRGPRVLISVYETTSAPEVHLLDRPVSLSRLLRACAEESFREADQEQDRAASQITRRFAERALRTELAPSASPSRVRACRGGQVEANRDVLSFGFDVKVESGPLPTSRAKRADVHAMLFRGQLWAHLHGRRAVVAKGPVLLAAQRMVVAVRALVDAWEAGRPTNVRLRAGDFAVGVRMTKDERATLTLTTAVGELRLNDVRPDEVALPILRLTSEMIRALIREDRSQTRNLRVTGLRDEVRALRRTVRAQGKPDGFVNEDAERLRQSVVPVTPVASPRQALPAPKGGMRFEARWRIELDGLDAKGTYFCGDRMVLSGPQHTLAVDRGTGDVIWAREGSASTLMAGTTLLRLSKDGEVELCSVADGEAYAQAQIMPRSCGPQQGFYMAGPTMAPVAVLAEGASHLVAIDLHTGQPRWRFHGRRDGQFHVRRVGRILLVADDSAIHAIDAATGEDLWRFAVRGRFAESPIVVGECVMAISESRKGSVYGIDLFSGAEKFRLELGEASSAPPIAGADVGLFALSDERLVAIDAGSGNMRWEVNDPGLGMGAAGLPIDDMLITNTPGGGLAATDLATGASRWTELLGDPIVDEVPRTLEPVLRGGALFVPAGDVHVVRPADGAVLATIDGDIVPDRLRVDERGWVYAAEESGHVAAFAPIASLRLIRGGR